MKAELLNHDHTPTELKVVNEDLSAALSAEEENTEALKALIEKRDDIISSHLTSLEKDKLALFAEAEWAVQETLQTEISERFKHARNDISRYLKAKKAVANYK